LAKRKSDGVQLGRSKGPAASLKLDEREEEIIGYLKKSISKRAIAKLTDCAPSTLYKWIKRRKIDKKILQTV
jgi:DNA invertase Pin-like site-specific DNA recombinase